MSGMIKSASVLVSKYQVLKKRLVLQATCLYYLSIASYVLVLSTPKYLERYRDHDPQDPQKSTGVGREVAKLVERIKNENLKKTVFPIYRKGNFGACVPEVLHEIAAFDASTDNLYHQAFYTIMQSFFLYDHVNSEPLKGMRDSFKQAFEAKQFNQYIGRKGSFSDTEKAFKAYQFQPKDLVNHTNLGINYEVFREVMLARMYLDGYGTEKDPDYAYELVA